MNTTDPRSVQSEIDIINLVIVTYSRWVVPIIFIFGVISNTLDIYVFTRPMLRRNPCCMYFLSSAVAALIYLCVNAPFRILQNGYNIDPTIYVLVLCKIRYFFTFTWRALTSWFLVLACLDRCLHSSANANLRQLSSFKVACRAIPGLFFLTNLGYVHVLIYYKINSSLSCTSEVGIYAVFLGVWHLLAYGIFPPFLMLLFSLLTIQHIRCRRVMPAGASLIQSTRDSNKDKNLIRMTFIQCLFVGLTTTTYAVTQLYTLITSNQVKDHLRITKDNLFTLIFGSISVIGHSTTFFVYILTSNLFRQQLFCKNQMKF